MSDIPDSIRVEQAAKQVVDSYVKDRNIRGFTVATCGATEGLQNVGFTRLTSLIYDDGLVISLELIIPGTMDTASADAMEAHSLLRELSAS